jgi:hypothetical protein
VELSDEINQVRYLLDEPDPTGRFSNAELTSDLNLARRDISLMARFPEIQINGFTVSGLQEYALSEDIIEVKRVYVAGQRVPKTDIPTMEGEAIGLYDMTAANYQPQWQAAPLAVYPVAADMGYPAPVALPYFQGARPMYYPRGGSVIGLVPPPGSVSTLRVEGIALAPDLVNLTDIDVFPRYYLNAICWKAIEYAMFSDQNPDGYQWATAQAEKHIGVLLDQIKNVNAPTGTRMLTYRSVWNVGGYGGGRRWR